MGFLQRKFCGNPVLSPTSENEEGGIGFVVVNYCLRGAIIIGGGTNLEVT